jgi:hypothetical protein
MKPDDHRMKILVPDDGILPKYCYPFPPVRFGRPFLDRYETPIGFVSRKQRLMFVRHFLTELGRAVARRFGQEISNRARSLVVFRCPPALSAAAATRLVSRFAGGDGSFSGPSSTLCNAKCQQLIENS